MLRATDPPERHLADCPPGWNSRLPSTSVYKNTSRSAGRQRWEQTRKFETRLLVGRHQGDVRAILSRYAVLEAAAAQEQTCYCTSKVKQSSPMALRFCKMVIGGAKFNDHLTIPSDVEVGWMRKQGSHWYQHAFAVLRTKPFHGNS
ncbi:hypothetical protein BaRGS_00012331 [Batillaria attramentaria]|uniref:Uncharacterized protein n=1 Tax=Batillaria attramentaria TaxID=370345 RepID=A0ABD0LAD6_9CAEN